MTRHLMNQSMRRVKRMRRTIDDSATRLHFEADMEACDTGRRYYRAVFLTLTYRDGDDWEPGHIGGLTRSLRKWMERHSERLRMAWVAETQARGAIHYHAVLFVPRHLRMPCPDRCGWWPWGMSKVETARNPVGYLTKYASKATEDDARRFPRGARMHGVAGLSAVSKRHRRLAVGSKWVRKAFAESLGSLANADVVKVRGGYLDRTSGLLVESPWCVEIDSAGGVWTVLKAERAA